MFHCTEAVFDIQCTNLVLAMAFRLTITASCPMNLQYFPMDRQLCHIEIESCKFQEYKYLYTLFTDPLSL